MFIKIYESFQSPDAEKDCIIKGVKESACTINTEAIIYIETAITKFDKICSAVDKCHKVIFNIPYLEKVSSQSWYISDIDYKKLITPSKVKVNFKK